VTYTALSTWTAIVYTNNGVEISSNSFSSPKCCGDYGLALGSFNNGTYVLTSVQWVGNQVNTVFQQFVNVNTNVGSIQQITDGISQNSWPRIAILPNLNYIIVWVEYVQLEIQAQMFSVQGNAITPIFVVNNNSSSPTG